MESRNAGCFKRPTTDEFSGETVYIAGPITGDLLGHLPAFFEAEDELRAAGHFTFNPARGDGGRTAEECIDLALEAKGVHTWAWYMRQGLKGLLECTGISMLPGWSESRGAVVEYGLAERLGFSFLSPEDGERMPRVSF